MRAQKINRKPPVRRNHSGKSQGKSWPVRTCTSVSRELCLASAPSASCSSARCTESWLLAVLWTVLWGWEPQWVSFIGLSAGPGTQGMIVELKPSCSPTEGQGRWDPVVTPELAVGYSGSPSRRNLRGQLAQIPGSMVKWAAHVSQTCSDSADLDSVLMSPNSCLYLLLFVFFYYL